MIFNVFMEPETSLVSSKPDTELFLLLLSLRELKLFHISIPSYLNRPPIRLNVIISLRTMSPKFVPLRFFNQCVTCISGLSMRTVYPVQIILFGVILTAVLPENRNYWSVSVRDFLTPHITSHEF
jgi:hypothetical protein